jgi:hypothetical protein
MREAGGKYAGFLLGLPFDSEDGDRKKVKLSLQQAMKVCRIVRCQQSLADGSEVVSLTCQLYVTPRNIPGTHFC